MDRGEMKTEAMQGPLDPALDHKPSQPSEEPPLTVANPAKDMPSPARRDAPLPQPLSSSSTPIHLPGAASPSYFPSRSASQNAATLQSMAGGDPQGERQLNVSDALSYLDNVKNKFQERPDVYNLFLDIMKDFKSQQIDTPGVIARVSSLFHGHPSLISGFNTFLPVGYRIDVGSDSHSSEYITVTTPSGTVMQSNNDPNGFSEPPPGGGHMEPIASMHAQLVPSFQHHLEPPSSPGEPGRIGGEAERANLGPAMDYVQRIKTRFSDDPHTYKQFLEILSTHKASANNAEVYAQVEELFKDAPDLSLAFRDFLPGVGMRPEDGDDSMIQGVLGKISTPVMGAESSRSAKRKPAEAPPSSVPAKRKRKAGDKDKDKDSVKSVASKSKKAKQLQAPPMDASTSFSQYATSTAPPSPRRTIQAHHPHPHVQLPPSPPTYRAPVMSASNSIATAAVGSDETQFFARVRRVVDSRESYNEFLRLINLFTQGYIDRARLVRESVYFLGDGDLMYQLKEILGWDEAQDKAALAREREEGLMPGRPLGVLDRPSKEELNIRHGSYRRLPADEINVQCTGRDEMCKSVLNDEWVSHPTFASEDSGFVAHKKNIYEEALHRCEEERHEYDFHIDGIVKTISILEPINNKVMQLGLDERNAYKLKPNFGGSGKAIHQRIIKKLYGRDAGLEVIQALQETPALAVPIVLGRLKQKEDEWKRAQREWNKVWREVDAQNYNKALDHQSIAFKAADKKALTAKAFVSQIEAVVEEQMAKRAMLVDPLFARTRPKHQLEFAMPDGDVLKDVVKLTFAYFARMPAQQTRIDAEKRRWVETRLYNIIRAFFMLGDEWHQSSSAKQGALAREEEVASSVAEADGSNGASGSHGGGKSRIAGGIFTGDLRKTLLKNEQAKSTRSQTRPLQSPAGSRRASPAPLVPSEDDMEVDSESRADLVPPAGDTPCCKRRSFYTNTWFYTTMRLIEVLYSRLHLFKTIAGERCRPAPQEDRKSSARTLESQTGPGHVNSMQGVSAAQYYELFLETCEKLFDNQIDQNAFEDQMRAMFGLQAAFKSFTIDKVIAVLIKQLQSWGDADQKQDKLYKLLSDERQLKQPTVDDHRKLLRQAEEILGPEENLFCIDWHPESKVVTFQLLSKDGSSLDDAEVLTGRWQSYVASFVSDEDTKSLPQSKVRRPFLRRNLPSAVRKDTPDVVAHGGLEIKVCVRTYRLFFVSNTEDFLWRKVPREEHDSATRRLAARNAARTQRLERLDKELGSVASRKTTPGPGTDGQ